MAETKGEDFYDREMAKHHAKREVEQGMCFLCPVGEKGG